MIKIDKYYDKLTDKKFLFYPTIFTLITALIVVIANIFREIFSNNLTIWSCIIFISLFMVGVCTIILQLVAFNHKMNQDIDTVITKGTVLDEVKTRVDNMNTDICAIKDKHCIISEIREHIELTKSIVSPNKYISLTKSKISWELLSKSIFCRKSANIT